MNTNLPIEIENTDSAEATKLFFDQYGISGYEYSANEVSATIGFFTAKGFSKESAQSIGAAILRQARFEGKPVFELLDLIKGFTPAQLNAVIAEILNNNRKPTSLLGFRSNQISKSEIERNIAP
jgi:predicted Zn-dependent peptidase